MSLDQLDKLLRETGGTNQYDRVLTLVEEAILSGISSGSEIVQAIAELGYNEQYVRIQLSKNAGGNPARHRWFKNEANEYRLHQ